MAGWSPSSGLKIWVPVVVALVAIAVGGGGAAAIRLTEPDPDRNNGHGAELSERTAGPLSEGSRSTPSASPAAPSRSASPSPANDFSTAAERILDPSEAGALIIDASVVREEIWGFEYLDAQSSDNWSGYFGGWTYDPPACAFLEKGALEAPAGWVMAYGTGPDEQEFFKQQVAIFDSVASAEAVFEEFHAVHDQCWQFRRDQGGGRAYDMTVTVATWDYLAGYPYVAVNVSANGAPARWNSDIVMVRAGNAVIWVNSGTYGDSESGSSSFTLLESELPALIAGL